MVKLRRFLIAFHMENTVQEPTYVLILVKNFQEYQN